MHSNSSSWKPHKIRLLYNNHVTYSTYTVLCQEKESVLNLVWEAMKRRSRSTKYQWVEESILKKISVPKQDCQKNISNVFCPSKDEREVADRRKCTPLLSIRAMLCIK